MIRIARSAVSLAVLAGLWITAGCSDRSNTSTPRRYAYPRIEAYGDIRRDTSIAGVSMSINASSTAVPTTDTRWLTLSYPRYGTTLHMSVATPADSAAMAHAIAGRLERISLNNGGAKVRTDTYTNAAGYDIRLVVAPEGTTTPVQFIAVSPEGGTLVSGAAVLGGNLTPADSIRPVIEHIEAEVFAITASLQ